MGSELLGKLEELTGEERCSARFLEGVRWLLLELRLRSFQDSELDSLLLRVEGLSSRLRESYQRSGPLRGEWERVANYEFRRLKEELSGLRELLEKRLEARRPPDLKELADEMREEGAIRESTWALLLSCAPEGMERGEVREALLRVLRLFSEFRALKEGEGGMGKEKGSAGGAR